MSMSKVQSKHHYVIVFMYNSWREAAREQESTLDLDEFCESLSSEEKEFINQNFPDWKKINFEPLIEIGFSQTQLKQLATQNLNTPEIVQESINHFAFGLKNNEK